MVAHSLNSPSMPGLMVKSVFTHMCMIYMVSLFQAFLDSKLYAESSALTLAFLATAHAGNEFSSIVSIYRPLIYHCFNSLALNLSLPSS